MSVTLRLDLVPTLHLAAAHRAPLRGVCIESTERLEGLRLRVSANPPLFQPLELAVDAVEAGVPFGLSPGPIRLDPERLRRAGEAALHVGLWQGEAPLAQTEAALRIGDPGRWPGDALPPELLAAFVSPKEAAALGLPAEPEALFAALRAGLAELPPPAGWHTVGQELLPPTALRTRGSATPLERCALAAAALLFHGQAPILVVDRARPLVGLWTAAAPGADPMLDDPALLLTRLEMGELRLFDPSADPPEQSALPDQAGFRYAVDLGAARAAGWRPPEEARLADPSPTRGNARLERYKRDLLDLTLRNRLLNFREGRQSIRLEAIDPDALLGALLEGRAIELRPPQDGAEGPPEPIARAERISAAWQRGVVYGQPGGAELPRRLLELYRRARSSLQESGVVTLYLAFGLLRWLDKEVNLAPLCLLPVALERTRGVFRLSWTGEGPRPNVTLLAKLDERLGGLPREAETPSALFQAWRARIPPQWEVVEELWLSRFAFTKAEMWEDLESRTDAILRNPLVRHLFDGDGAILPFVRDPVPPAALDSTRGVPLTVLDSDPSQMTALCAAEDGSSFVLQGPPGTGKSQTITNLIAALIAQGRTVLFVSEKRAALEVVERRLQAVGLGPFTLELHAPDTSRRAVLRQLAEAVAAAESRAPTGWDRFAAALEQERAQLNALVAALGEIGPYGRTVQSACEALIGLREAPELRADWGEGPTREQFEAIFPALELLIRRMGEVGEPAQHPLRSVRLATWTPAIERPLSAALEALAEAARGLRAASVGLGEALGLSRGPENDPELRQVESLIRLAGQDPDLQPASLRLEAEALRERVRPWLQEGQRNREANAALSPRWRPELQTLDLERIAAGFGRWMSSFFAFFMLFFHRWTLRRAAVGALPKNPEIHRDLATARAARDSAAALNRVESEAKALLGALWTGASTPPDAVELRIARVGALRGAAAELSRWAGPLETLLGLAGEGRAKLDTEAVTAWRAALDRYRQTREIVSNKLQLEADAFGSPASVIGSAVNADRLRLSLPKLRAWTAYRAARDGAEALGLAPFAALLAAGQLAPDQAARAVERSIHQHFWERAVERTPALAGGTENEERAARFRGLDERTSELARQEVFARVAARVPPLQSPGAESQLLRHQLSIRRNHRPIRQLFREMPTLLRRLKPCALMSPLSVARSLDPSLEGFDVVIFDEASQIPPPEAIGAIARGRQAIIVGDSRQLPPTSFFEHEGEEAPDELDLLEMKSILEEAIVAGFPQLRLRWHYRSQHESLIDFSNRQFYDNQLLTFPAARKAGGGLGVAWVPVPGGVYDRGGSRTNAAEAAALVAELERALDDPTRPSVGVVTFSMPQQRLIEDLVDALLQRRPELEERFSEGQPEPVFVKNLENVQGDERDVMLFSVCYGADKRGVVAMNFGPLNRAGGERRLNVAITRARLRLVVFSSLRPEQMDPARCAAEGVAQLRRFLEYAARGAAALDAAHGLAPPPAPGPLARALAAALRAEGLVVHHNAGQAGYRVELAIEDPADPQRFLLGIETDGPVYYGSACARERDRLRPQVLQALGWSLLRVWAADAWLDWPGTLDRVRSALRRANQAPVKRAEAPPAPSAEDALNALRERLSAPLEALRPDHATEWAPIEIPPMEGDITDPAQTPELARRLGRIAGTHGPVHLEVAARALLAASGRVQMNATVHKAIGLALASLPAAERPRLVDGFFWPAGVDPGRWTGLRLHTNERREAHHIPPREAANAALWLLGLTGGLEREELGAEMARLFGFGPGARVSEAMEAGVALLLAGGEAVERGGAIRPRRG